MYCFGSIEAQLIFLLEAGCVGVCC